MISPIKTHGFPGLGIRGLHLEAFRAALQDGHVIQGLTTHIMAKHHGETSWFLHGFFMKHHQTS